MRERYACSVPGCEWRLTVPAPQVQGLEHLGGGAVLTVAEVPMPAVAAALAEHLATHDEGDLRAAMLAALRRLG